MESIFIKQGIVIRVLLEKWRNYGIIDEKMPDLGRNDLQRNAGEKKMKKILDLITAEITQAMMQNTERLLYLTDRIFVNTSVTEQWQLPKNTKRHRL